MGVDITMHRTKKLTIARKEYIRSERIHDNFMTLTIKGVNSEGEELNITFFTDNNNLELELEEEE